MVLMNLIRRRVAVYTQTGGRAEIGNQFRHGVVPVYGINYIQLILNTPLHEIQPASLIVGMIFQGSIKRCKRD